jgi:hypothetical protein
MIRVIKYISRTHMVIRESTSDTLNITKKNTIFVPHNQYDIHILSRTLNIPSIYNVEHIDLPEHGMVEFDTNNKIGWVTTYQ